MTSSILSAYRGAGEIGLPGPRPLTAPERLLQPGSRRRAFPLSSFSSELLGPGLLPSFTGQRQFQGRGEGPRIHSEAPQFFCSGAPSFQEVPLPPAASGPARRLGSSPSGCSAGFGDSPATSELSLEWHPISVGRRGRVPWEVPR